MGTPLDAHYPRLCFPLGTREHKHVSLGPNDSEAPFPGLLDILSVLSVNRYVQNNIAPSQRQMQRTLMQQKHARQSNCALYIYMYIYMCVCVCIYIYYAIYIRYIFIYIRLPCGLSPCFW